MKKNIVVMFGGISTEHDISIVSAFYVLKYINEYLYNPILIYVGKDNSLNLVENVKMLSEFQAQKMFKQVAIIDGGVYVLKKKKYVKFCDVDAVLPVMHGLGTEDGTIDGYLKINNVARATPNLEVASIGMDKAVFKNCISSFAPVLDFVELSDVDISNTNLIAKNVDKKIGFPCIIKPARQGSSIGIEICKNKENFQNLLKKCLKFDKKVIIEKYLTNFREFNIAIYSTVDKIKISEIEEPLVQKDMLSFEEKYLNFSGNLSKKLKQIPPKISKKLYAEIVDTAEKVYKKLDCNGVIRFDFIYDNIGKKLYVNEMNTIPGSLALYLFAPKGISEDEVINDLIIDAIRRRFLEKNQQVEYKSDVLKLTQVGKFQK